ncbi:MAG: hypothetical protein HOJ35_06835 [Bdellovibrionales bacterium]|jgi:hypothetical protein|nr:hypothetical protein [Bdellovibrionales bacterium]
MKKFIIIFSILLCNSGFSICNNNIKPVNEVTSYVTTIHKDDMPSLDKSLFSYQVDHSTQADTRNAINYNDQIRIKNLTTYSVFQNKGNEFVIDLYFHGNKNKFVIKIANIDLRIFFPPSLLIKKKTNLCKIVVQGHFAEYIRKSKVFNYKREANKTINFSKLSRDIKHSIKYERLDIENFVLTNNCRGLGSFEFEWPGMLRGYIQFPPKYIDQLLQAYSKDQYCDKNLLARKTVGTEVRTSKHFTHQYKENLDLTIKDNLIKLYSTYFDTTYQWYSTGSFEKAVGTCNIKNFIPKTKNLLKIISPINHLTGEINYEQFLSETQVKSNYILINESLSYVMTPCKQKNYPSKPPINFSPPKKHENMNPELYWKTFNCKIVPHTFWNYNDIINYQVHLSKFEVDGIYPGKSRDYDKRKIFEHDENLNSDSDSRIKYNYKKYIPYYESAQLIRDKNQLTIDLKNTKGINFVIGNIDIQELKKESTTYFTPTKLNKLVTTYQYFSGINKIIGINPSPLFSMYDHLDPIIKHNGVFSLFYNNSGNILNHHDPSIGIEQWYLKLVDNHLILDLISHERILPVRKLSILIPDELIK